MIGADLSSEQGTLDLRRPGPTNRWAAGTLREQQDGPRKARTIMAIGDLLAWFSGGSNQYMQLVHCMNHDMPWILLTVSLDLIVASGYVLIALHWRRNEAILQPSPAKGALGQMKKIFIFCGLCGYLFIPIKMFWPAWRLYDGFLALLAYYTWRYALGSRDLTVVYEQLGRTEQLAQDLEDSRAETRRKSYFLNAISHDLKTPLNGMMLQAELAELGASSNDPELLREALVEIKSCARTTADLLNQFLELGRLDWSDEPSKIETFRLAELLHHVAGQARVRAVQKGFELVLHDLPEIEIVSDRVKLERILFNLVDNAIKFTREGSVRLGAKVDASGVRIHVEDTGEGISIDDQALIFEDFTQLHNRERDSRKGFGLGLAIARRLARQLGGDLAVESTPGRGSRFTVSFAPAILPPRTPGERPMPLGAASVLPTSRAGH